MRGIRQRKCLTITEASRAGEVGGQRERRGCPVSELQLPSPRASGPLPRQEPWTPIRLIAGGQVQLGLPEKGLVGLCSDRLGVCVGEQLPLMIQEELSEGVDGINGLEGDSSILGPQQIRAKDDSQVSVGHLVLVTMGRYLWKEMGLQLESRALPLTPSNHIQASKQ